MSLSSSGTLLSYVMDKYEKSNSPIAVLLELTHNCNLRCIHCYVPNYLQPEGMLLTLDEWDKVVSGMVDLGVVRVTLSGGELMTRTDWYDIAKMINEKGFLITIFTNGTMIDDDAAEKLALINPSSVEISVYGADAVMYEEVTAIPGAFARFEHALELLKKNDVKVVLKPVIIKQNVRVHSKILEYIKNTGFELRFDFSPYLIPNSSDISSCQDYRLTDGEMVELLMAEDFTICPPDELCMCQLGTRGFVVGPFGHVRPCVVHPEIVGNVRTESIKQIWKTSEVLRDLRNLSKRNFSQCSTCELRPYCQPCMAMNVVETGSITVPAPENCRIARNRKVAIERKGLKEQEAIVEEVS
jgi:radical SAM protein with 4Fe4S-binding SPASM domain